MFGYVCVRQRGGCNDMHRKVIEYLCTESHPPFALSETSWMVIFGLMLLAFSACMMHANGCGVAGPTRGSDVESGWAMAAAGTASTRYLQSHLCTLQLRQPGAGGSVWWGAHGWTLRPAGGTTTRMCACRLQYSGHCGIMRVKTDYVVLVDCSCNVSANKRL